MRWEIDDRYGNHIYMTDERWQHALEKCPWLFEYLDDVLDTVRRGKRQQDPLKPRKYKYYLACQELEPEYNHIVVVILFGEKENELGEFVPNNYVVNVWAVYIYGK